VSRSIHHTIFALVAVISIVSGGVCLGAEPKTQQASPRAKKFVPAPLPLLPAEQAWIATLDAPPSAGGVMDGERIYIPIQPEEIHALDRSTGMPIWKRSIESAWPPVLHDGVLYIAASDEIHALDPATGGQKWRVPFEMPMTSPLVSSGELLVAVFDPGDVIAFAAEDGRQVWMQSLGATSRYAPVSNGMRLFFALDDSRVVALGAADGARAWETRLDGMLSQPSIARDRVFVGSTNNSFYALDDENGRLTWRWKSGGDVVGAAADGRNGVYYASLDNVLRAVNRGNGNQRWLKQIPTRPLLTPQAVGDGIEYEEIVVVTGVTSEIDAFVAKTGAAAGMYLPPSDLEGAPLIDPRLKPYAVAMVVITRDGRAIGLRPAAMNLPEPVNAPFTTELPGRKLERERLTPPPAGSRTP
jgi:outer membrane protein assembly factor BamB